MTRQLDLHPTTPRYGFVVNEREVVILTTDQVSDFLAKGTRLTPVGAARVVWGAEDLLPQNR